MQVGGIYALMALSYYVIISTTGILNFAQGEWTMVAAVLGVVLLGRLPYPLAVLLSVAGATLLAVAAERLIVWRLERQQATLFIVILSLLGVMTVVRYGTGTLFGREEWPLPGPFGDDPIQFGSDIYIQPQTLVVYAATAAIFAGVVLFMQRTWLGRSLRVSAIDPIGASLVGVNLEAVRVLAFAIGGLIAAIVGWLYAPLYAAGYLIGVMPGVKGFIVMVIGGMGSPLGSLAGGIALGIIEVAAARYMPSIYSEGVAFAALMAVLFLRPQGLIGAAWKR